jgi:hypothetical protein
MFDIGKDSRTEKLKFIIVNSILKPKREFFANSSDFTESAVIKFDSDETLLFFVKLGCNTEEGAIQQKILSLILHCDQYSNDNNLIDSNNIFIDLLCNDNVTSSKILN